jgi:hypothetical protein
MHVRRRALFTPERLKLITIDPNDSALCASTSLVMNRSLAYALTVGVRCISKLGPKHTLKLREVGQFHSAGARLGRVARGQRVN